MPYIPLEELTENNKSLYKLVLVAAERANEVLAGAKPLIVPETKKYTSIALEEICQGKVKYVSTEDA